METSDITKITAEDLGIVDTDKYCYIMTYSFPCQDLSLAGKQKGMAKGENTRSGLLWEVERLLNECTELPQILLMENVTQVHGTKNVEHFNEWLAYLESKGYKNYWKDLNAKNFCIPQNRNRTFMVSVLGDYTYEFPQEFPLKKRLKDLLEDSVDEKFYISNEKAESIVNGDVSKTIRAGDRGSDGKLVNGSYNRVWKTDKYSGCINTTKVQEVGEKEWQNTLRIRKLTPKECWRLMGFQDEDFEKAAQHNSNSQLYKQAGNSICVSVLYYIFKEMM